MDYGQIISRSWRITWENKFLWVLGFLVALTRIGGNSSNFNTRTSNPNFGESVEQIMAFSGLLIGLCCLFVLIGLALWLLSLAAKGGLISAVSRIDNGETVTLGDAFRAGTGRIWTLVGMHLVLYLPFFFLLIVGVGGTVALLAGSGITFASLAEEPSAVGDAVAATLGLFIFCLCGLICVLVLLGFFLQFINAFAYRGIMLRHLGATESLSHGWQVFRANLGEVLLLAVLFFALGIGYSLLTAVILIPLAFVVFVPAIGLMMNGGSPGVLENLFLLSCGLFLGVVGAA
jgi:hypothetical protein